MYASSHPPSSTNPRDAIHALSHAPRLPALYSTPPRFQVPRSPCPISQIPRLPPIGHPSAHHPPTRDPHPRSDSEASKRTRASVRGDRSGRGPRVSGPGGAHRVRRTECDWPLWSVGLAGVSGGRGRFPGGSLAAWILGWRWWAGDAGAGRVGARVGLLGLSG